MRWIHPLKTMIALGAWMILGTAVSVPAAVNAADIEPVDSTESADAANESTDTNDDTETADDAPTETTSADTAETADSGTTYALAARWDLSEGEETSLIGYRDSTDFAITLPTGWIANEGILSAEITASDQIRADTALRVDVAGQPIGSWSLENDIIISAPVSLNAAELTDAEVPISFATTTPLVGDPVCADPNHVARWVSVQHPMLTATLEPTDLDVTRTIRGIGPVSMATGEPIHIVTEEQPSDDILEVIGNLGAAIGRYGQPREWSISYDGKAPAVPGSQIRISEADNEAATIAVEVVDNRPILTMTGDIEGLLWLSDALASVDRIDYFHSTEVAADDIPATPMPRAGEVFLFEDEGYDDRTLRGTGYQSLIYRIHIPAGVPPDAATLALYATHAPSLATADATVSVRINGSPEEIVAVTNDSGQLDALHTIAPADLRPGLNYVKLSTLLSAAGSGTGCGGAGTAWFTVSNGSGVGVERPEELQEVRLGVEDARFALATPVDFNTTDVAIADATAPSDVALALTAIAALSERAMGGSPRLVEDHHANRAGHLVVVGADAGRELLDSVPKAARTDSPASTAAQALGIIAAQPSPFATGKVLLAFTGPTDQGAARAIEAAMTSEANDITSHFALASPDTVRSVGAEDLEFDDLQQLEDSVESALPVPTDDSYDEWVVAQAERISAAKQEETDIRRIYALSLFVFVSIVAGLWWVQRSRRRDQAGGH